MKASLRFIQVRQMGERKIKTLKGSYVIRISGIHEQDEGDSWQTCETPLNIQD